MYYYHTDFFLTGQNRNSTEGMADTAGRSLEAKLPDALSPVPPEKSEARLWLEERRARRKSAGADTSAASTHASSTAVAPLREYTATYSSLLGTPTPIGSLAYTDRRAAKTDDVDANLRDWLNNRRAATRANGINSTLDILSRISPIKATDYASTEENTTVNTSSEPINNARSGAASMEQLCRPVSATEEVRRPPPTSAEELKILMSSLRRGSSRGTAELIESTSPGSATTIGRPRSFYREYIDMERRRQEQKEEDRKARLLQEEIEMQKQVQDGAEDLAMTMASDDGLGVINEEEEEEESDEDEVFDTGAAFSAMQRMKELHFDTTNNNTGNSTGKPRNKNSIAGKNGKRGSQLRKNSEAEISSVNDVVFGADGRKNSRAQNNFNLFEGRKNSQAENAMALFHSPSTPRKKSSKPVVSPARSTRTVIKRFNEGAETLKQKLTAQEQAAKEALEKRLSERNQQMSEDRARRRASEKGWK